jgi:hypothetical protein
MCKFVKTQKLAGYLMMNGFRLLRMDKDRTNPIYDIYFFEKREGLEEAIDEYKVKYGRKED